MTKHTVAEMQNASIRRIVGPTILLRSGTYFDFADPEHSEITIQDVAWGLGSCNRFAGQTRPRHGGAPYYTVAEHCYRMSKAVPHHLAYAALMHECGEAVCGDMTRPLKSICPDYKRVEKRCDAAIRARFNVPTGHEVELKLWDMRMLMTERRDLMTWTGEEWPILDEIAPLPDLIRPVNAEDAVACFLYRYRQLTDATG